MLLQPDGEGFFTSLDGICIVRSLVPDCWCCAQKFHPDLIVICVYAVNRLYVEKEQKQFLGAESLVSCYRSYILYFV
jgi:hypothetical protein